MDNENLQTFKKQTGKNKPVSVQGRITKVSVWVIPWVTGL